MTTRTSRTLWLDNREPNPEAVLGPTSAQFQLWLAQAQRDHGSISDREMGQMEGKASILAQRSRMLWNPFTGEFRTQAVRDHYTSGQYLRTDRTDQPTRKTTIIMSGG